MQRCDLHFFASSGAAASAACISFASGTVATQCKCQLLGQRIQMQTVPRDNNEGTGTSCYDLHFFRRILAAYGSFNMSGGPNCRRCSGMTKRAVGRGCYDLHFSCPISAASAAGILAAYGSLGANAYN